MSPLYHSRGMAESFDTPEEAIGWPAIGGLTSAGQSKTANSVLFAMGYTETYYFRDKQRVKWTVLHNPAIRKWAFAHRSSGD
jgi:hypothetical protein